MPSTMGMPIATDTAAGDTVDTPILDNSTTLSVDTTGSTTFVSDIWFIVAMVAIGVAVIECLLLSSLFLVMMCKRRRKKAGKEVKKTAIVMQNQEHCML